MGQGLPIVTKIYSSSLKQKQIGFAVSIAGDINKDSIDDTIIATTNGTIFIIYGKYERLGNSIDLSNLTPSQGFKITDCYMSADNYPVSSAGDINSDGIDDIIIAPTGGITYVIYGKKAGLADISLTNFTISQGFTIDSGSYSVSAAGDVNNDGISDIIIGINVLQSYVIYGKSSDLANIHLSNLTPAQGFKITADKGTGEGYIVFVRYAGDVNHDGIDDIIIGLPDQSLSGEIYVVYGKTGGVTGISLSALTSNQGFKISGDSLELSGVSVSGIGDVNHDGIDDVAFGGMSNIARGAHIIYGSSSEPSSEGFRLMASPFDGANGQLSAGDINGDGISDIILGTPVDSPKGRIHAGTTSIIYGQNYNLGDITLYNLTSNQGFQIFGATGGNPNTGDGGDISGCSVSVGDVDGDNISDIIIGAKCASLDLSGDCDGMTYIVYGQKGGLSDIDLAYIPTPTPTNNDNHGWFYEHEWELLGPLISFAGVGLLVGVSYYLYKHSLHSGIEQSLLNIE